MYRIIILCTITLVLTSCSAATQLMSDLSRMPGKSGGVSSSLGNTDHEFSGIGNDFADSASSQEYATLNQHFHSLQKLDGNLPSSVPETYFQITDSFRQNIGNHNINNRDENGKTALMVAIENNDTATAQYLIQEGALIDDETLQTAKNVGNTQILILLEEQK